jgi:hypothetical protein
MALGCGLTSVRANREENYENELLVRQKHMKKKKLAQLCLRLLLGAYFPAIWCWEKDAV